MKNLLTYLFVIIFLFSCKKSESTSLLLLKPYVGKYFSSGYLDYPNIENYPEWTLEITENYRVIFNSFGSPDDFNRKIINVTPSTYLPIQGNCFTVDLKNYGDIDLIFRNDSIFLPSTKLRDINPYKEKTIFGKKVL